MTKPFGLNLDAEGLKFSAKPGLRVIFRSSVRTTRKIENFRVFAARSTHDADHLVIDSIECWIAFCRMIVSEHSIRRNKYMSRRQQTPKQSEQFCAEKLARRGVSRVPTHTAGTKMRLSVGNQVIKPRESAVPLGTHRMLLSSVSANYRKLPAHGPASLELVEATLTPSSSIHSSDPNR